MRNSEHAVIGAILESPDTLHLVADSLRPEMFEDALCAITFQRMLELSTKSIPIDLLRVTKEVGMAHAAELSEIMAGSFGNIESHGKVIIEKFCMRELQKLARNIQDNAHVDVFELMDKVNMGMIEIEQNTAKGSIESIGQIISQLHRKKTNEYHPTGFTRLDSVIGGLTNNNLIIVAGRPGMGKTSLALSMMYQLAKQGKAVGFFSLEMSKEQIVNRIRSMVSNVPAFKIEKGILNQYDTQALIKADDYLDDFPIHIEPTAALNIHQFRSQSIKMVKKHKVKVIFVDYLQLMHGSKEYRGNKVQEVTEISRQLKRVAMELNIPVVALAQLSRAVESRGGDKKPQLSDLRESGSIEQDADIVTFVYRPEYYGFDVEIDFDRFDLTVPAKGTCSLLLGKHRGGDLANIPFSFNKTTTQFTDYQEEFNYQNFSDTPF